MLLSGRLGGSGVGWGPNAWCWDVQIFCREDRGSLVAGEERIIVFVWVSSWLSVHFS